MTDWQSRIDALDALSRTRALTNAESLELENAIRNQTKGFPGNRTRWTAQDDDRLRKAIKARLSRRRMAEFVGRSPAAVRARLRTMRCPPDLTADCRKRGVIQ